MDQLLEKIAGDLCENGWKDVSADTFADVPFELVGSRRFLLNKWTVLVRRISQMDGEEGKRFAVELKTVTSRTKSLTGASRYIFCVVADKVDPTIKQIINLENSGIRRFFRFQAGRVRILIVDRSTREILGRVPTLPYDAHIFVKQLYAILTSTM